MNGHADQNGRHKEVSQKRLESEKRRLERMDEVRRMQEQRKMQISCALQAIGSPAAAAALKRKSRTVFKSESESEDEKDAVPKRMKTEEASTRKLFNHEEDKFPDMQKGDLSELVKKDCPIGNAGEGMMKMEMLFADDRFQLDERFMEEDEKQVDPEEEHHNEKRNELGILSRVLGKEVKSSLRAQFPSKKMSICPFARFDPDDPIHVQWLNEQQGEKTLENSEIKAKTLQDDLMAKKEPAEMTIGGTFYNMDPEFADELKKKNGKAPDVAANGFSFLSLMGRPEAVPTPMNKVSGVINGPSAPEISQVKPAVVWQKPEEPLSWLKEVLEKGILDSKQAAHPIFAIDAKQEEVRSIVASFRQPKNAEHLNASWKKMKEHFVQLSKSRRKLAVKNFRGKTLQPPQGVDASDGGPEKNKFSSSTSMPDIPISSNNRKETKVVAKSSGPKESNVKPEKKRRGGKKND